MSRYIDADKIDWRLIIPTKVTIEEEHILYRARKLVDSQPKLDAVEVVRCKDCKWYTIYEVKNDGTMDKRYAPSFCGLYRKHKKKTYFCADGERIEDEI